MDKLEDRLERLINQMCEMVLYLLCLLDVEDIDDEAAQAIEVLILVHFIILHFFSLQTHVAAHSTHSRVSPHVVVHLVDGLGVAPETHVQQDRVFGLELITETVEEPVVRG